jgi:sigma-E factor negative regulatory protein RseB
MMRPLVIALALLTLSGPTRANAPDSWIGSGAKWVKQLWRNDAQQWLDRINPAVSNHNYSGVLVLAQGKTIETLSVEHTMSNGQETLILKTLSGSPRELIKRGGKVRIDALRANNVAAGQTSFSQFANAIDNKWYSVKLGEKARVAGRSVQLVDIEAKDDWRYSYHLWLDEETALPLKVVTLDEHGTAIEQMVFTQIKITPVAGREKAAKVRELKPLDNPFKTVKGYQLVARQGSPASTHYLYSDGLTSVSLYVEPSRQKEKAQMQRDAINGLILDNGKTRHVVLGKAPIATLERILDASLN